MFNGIKVIDADGHVMEPNELYDQYLDPKFRADLEELKLVAESRRSKWFFGFFHQLNTGRPKNHLERRLSATNGSSASFISSTRDGRSGLPTLRRR